MSRSTTQKLLPLRSGTGSRALRERELLLRESALVLEGLRGVRLAGSDRLPFNR